MTADETREHKTKKACLLQCKKFNQSIRYFRKVRTIVTIQENIKAFPIQYFV